MMCGCAVSACGRRDGPQFRTLIRAIVMRRNDPLRWLRARRKKRASEEEFVPETKIDWRHYVASVKGRLHVRFYPFGIGAAGVFSRI